MRLNSGFPLIVLVALLSGCAFNPPKTQSEYRKRMAGDEGKIETIQSKRPLEDIKREIREFSAQCYNTGSTTTRREYAVSTSFTTIMYPEWVKTRPGWNTFQIRYDSRPRAMGMPEGGNWVFMADLKSNGKGTTAQLLYPNTSFSAPDNIKAILAGKQPRCEN
jgi:hypothetical protein